ncbi:hypothetical protein EDD18DRAFT_1464642 [Armillaria luteobubalina]|uniref:C2H2-type domain-containing protein n=1 Tax=Armillaria luteobubalina TaxID=153913 RepID=A0AA39Q1D1_9AGAR|nr:hypothetical protein EDD18DRAFT_1464642 [Armillaria luteobubalina]
MPKPTISQVCETCQSVVANLNRHMRTHLPYSARPYLCPWPGCTVATWENDALKVHINCKHGEKPHVCPTSGCGFATGDSARLTRHRQKVHGYIPAKRANRNRRAVKVEDGSGTDATGKYIIVESDRAGPISTRKPRQRQPLGIKCEEELPISALPFSFINVTAPAYTPPVYDQPRVQRRMTAAYQFPASWTPQAQVPLPVQGLDAHHHHTYAPTAYTCDAMYPSSHYHYSAVPRVFAEQPYAVADQVLGGWPCPQAASYVDYGYAGTGLGVGGGAQWAQAFPKYGTGMDTSSESPVDDLIDSMARCDVSYY